MFPPNACRGERCGAWGRTAPSKLVRFIHSTQRGAPDIDRYGAGKGVGRSDYQPPRASTQIIGSCIWRKHA